MGAADDIKKGLTKTLANFTKQRKAEEKHVSAVRWRTSRITKVRGMFLTEAVEAVIVDAYMKVSDNNQLPALVRQIFYVVRPKVEDQTDKPLTYKYFGQTLLPDYIRNHVAACANWDVVYDDRGHFIEPHTGRTIGLGTLNVREYLKRVGHLQFEEADFAAAAIKTYGPHGCYGALFYIEKEGFFPLFKRVNLAKRYDVGIMSSKGMSVTAARELADRVCGLYRIPLLVLHDFDRPGIIIKDTLENDTRRYTYKYAPVVIDLGLTYDDIGGLTPEQFTSKISDERLREAGLREEAINFLDTQRVELNAMTSRQLVDFIEGKFKQHHIDKVIPDKQTLVDTYRLFVKSNELSEAFEEVKERLEAEGGDTSIEVPDNIEKRVRATLKETPEIPWHRAVQLIIDPDAPPNNEEEDEEEGDAVEDDEVDG
jgi:hypothetical protein